MLLLSPRLSTLYPSAFLFFLSRNISLSICSIKSPQVLLYCFSLHLFYTKPPTAVIQKIFEKSKLMLDFLKNDGIINLVHDFGELCNGSTTDSDSVCWGSNPYSPAMKKAIAKKQLLFSVIFALQRVILLRSDIRISTE